MPSKKPFPTLALTSPVRRGPAVSEAQFLLKKNRHDRRFYDGKIDGEYGPLTAAAAREAKFILGYPRHKISNNFGAILRSYLVNPEHPDYKQLPLLYRERMRQRLAEIRRNEQKYGAVLSFAHTFKGYRESPGNHTMFGKWYGLDGNPWCAMFTSYCLSKKGFSFKEAYVPFIVENARRGRDNTFVTKEPIGGHMVCFDWQKNGEYDHIGFFDHWVNRANGVFATVEGNTLPPGGSGNQSNGGGVYARERDLDAANVVFVGWKA